MKMVKTRNVIRNRITEETIAVNVCMEYSRIRIYQKT